MRGSLFSPRVRRLGELFSLLIFFTSGVYFMWQGWQFQNVGAWSMAWTSLGLGTLCAVQFSVLLWLQHRRRTSAHARTP